MAKALSNAAGPALQEECRAIGKVNTGNIVVTSGGKLNCKLVFHTSCASWNQQSGEQVQIIFDIKVQKYAVFRSSSRGKSMCLKTNV